MACDPILEITDGTTTVNLLEPTIGFLLKSWRQSLAQPKGGGTWQSSPFDHGRSLVLRVNENVIDTMTLSVRSNNQDSTISILRELYQLLEKATSYWITTWQSEPVWIAARAPNETNTRYAIIKDWRVPADAQPVEQPFFSPSPAITDLQLTLEHALWTDNEPGSGECVEISEGGQFYSHLEFDGADTSVNCGSDASLDDLPDADFTAEGWIRPIGWGENNEGRIFDKYTDSDAEGWRIHVAQGPLPYLPSAHFVFFADHVTLGYTVRWEINVDSEWHHFAVVFDFATNTANHYWVGNLQSEF